MKDGNSLNCSEGRGEVGGKVRSCSEDFIKY